MSEKKEIKLFKDRTVVVIVKKHTQQDNMNVVVPDIPDAL